MVDKLINSEANKRRIKFVEECFGTSGQPLYVAGRVLVGEGVLTKICRKKPKPRQFFLFNDCIVYGNILINKKKYNKQRQIPLEEVQISGLSDAESPGEGLRNGWIISSGQKSFAVYAATGTEKAEWMAHIEKCVRDHIVKTGAGGKGGSVEHAAVWVPDNEANTCMHCRRTQFTIINRRHHCRKCGAVVCAGCSAKKFLLPAQSPVSPLRVCDSCYSQLSKGFHDIHGDGAAGAGSAAGDSSLSAAAGDSSGDDTSDDDIGSSAAAAGASPTQPAAAVTTPSAAAGGESNSAAASADEPPETTFYGDRSKSMDGGGGENGAVTASAVDE